MARHSITHRADRPELVHYTIEKGRQKGHLLGLRDLLLALPQPVQTRTLRDENRTGSGKGAMLCKFLRSGFDSMQPNARN